MNMKKRFEKYSRNNTLLSILMVLVGVVLFIWPGKSLEVAAKILGFGLMIGAVAFGFSWFQDRNGGGGDYTTLAIAIVCLVAGVVVVIAPHGVITLLPKLIGVGVLVNGILNLSQALEMRNRGISWIPALVMAALTIAAGAFLILFSFGAMKAAVMVIGGVSVYNGLSNLLIEKKYRKA